LSDIIDRGTNSVTRAKTEDGKLYVHTHFADDKSLDQNERIRSSGMLDKHKLGLHDNEDTRMIISCPSNEQWAVSQRLYPDVHALLQTRGQEVQDDLDRMKGARQLSILFPEWVVMSRI